MRPSGGMVWHGGFVGVDPGRAGRPKPSAVVTTVGMQVGAGCRPNESQRRIVDEGSPLHFGLDSRDLTGMLHRDALQTLVLRIQVANGLGHLEQQLLRGALYGTRLCLMLLDHGCQVGRDAAELVCHIAQLSAGVRHPGSLVGRFVQPTDGIRLVRHVAQLGAGTRHPEKISQDGERAHARTESRLAPGGKFQVLTPPPGIIAVSSSHARHGAAAAGGLGVAPPVVAGVPLVERVGRSVRSALNGLDELLTAASARAADHGVDAWADLSAASAAVSVSLQAFEALAADLEVEAGEVVVGLARAADRLKANAASLRRPSRLARRAELLLAAMVRTSAAGVSALPPPAGRPPELALTEAAKAQLRSVREATQKLDDIAGPLHGLSSAVRRVQAAAKPLSVDMLPWHRAVAAAASAAAAVAESTSGLRAVVTVLEGAGPGKKGKKKGPPPAQVEAAVRAARLDHLRSELGSFRRNTDALIRGKAVVRGVGLPIPGPPPIP
eukprot:scaffold6144_cov94-Isochrysis_galbana.AAC.6